MIFVINQLQMPRNGRQSKTIQTRLGETTIQTPRDRQGSI